MPARSSYTNGKSGKPILPEVHRLKAAGAAFQIILLLAESHTKKGIQCKTIICWRRRSIVNAVNVLVSILIGYAAGCVQSAYLIGRIFGNLDIRKYGSGNAGASNITTIMGTKFGVFVGLIDILKGAFAVLFVGWLYPSDPTLAFLAGIMAVIGHIFPFYLRFRGGKGVAALVGVMLGVDWRLGILFVLLVAVPALISDYIVAGSFTTFVALPVVALVRGYPIWIILLTLTLTGLCFYLHRGNIRRILAGEELKISAVLFKKAKPE